MRIIVIALFLVACCAGEAFSFGEGWIGLYADDAHGAYTVFYSGSMTQFDTWVWISPRAPGVQAAEFRLAYPVNVIPSVVTGNPAITASLGDVMSGISVAFGACQRAWVWTHHQTCYLMSYEVGEARILERPGVGLQFASCELGFPIYPLTVLNYLYVNYYPFATESSSWGAIKSLF